MCVCVCVCMSICLSVCVCCVLSVDISFRRFSAELWSGDREWMCCDTSSTAGLALLEVTDPLHGLAPPADANSGHVRNVGVTEGRTR